MEQSQNKRLHSITDQAHHCKKNILLKLHAIGSGEEGEEIKMDNDEKMEEKKSIESLYGIK